MGILDDMQQGITKTTKCRLYMHLKIKISMQFDYAEQASDAFNSTPLAIICIYTTIQNILRELSLTFQEREKK